MRRFLALLATLAIVMSMFSGIAFAADNHKIVLDEDSFVCTTAFNTATVSGRIVDPNGFVSNRDYNISLVIDGETYTTVAQDGRFSFLINTAAPVGEYTLTATDTDGVPVTVDSTTVKIVNNLELQDSIEFVYPVSGQYVVRGVLKDAEGNPIAGKAVYLAYQTDFDPADAVGTSIIDVTTSSTGQFGFFVTGDQLNKVGKLGIYVDEVLHAEGKVSAGELAFTVTPGEVTNNLVPADVTFEFDVPAAYLDVNDATQLAAGYTIDVQIKSGSTEVDSITGILDVETTQTIDITNWATGDYTVVATLKSATTDILSGTATLTVVAPGKYTLVGWTLDEINVETTTINFGTSFTVYEYDRLADTSTPLTFYSVTAEGAGMAETTVQNLVAGDDNGTSIDLTPTKVGVITVTIEAYSSADATSPVVTYTKEIEVKGYNVELNTDTIQVDTKNDLVFTVTDEDGNPINNAYIFVGDLSDFSTKTVADALIVPTTVNITNGVYTKADFKHTAVETLDVAVAVYDENAVNNLRLMAKIDDAIDVIGEPVYTVDVNKNVLVNGLQEKVLVTITDADGNVVNPDEVVWYQDGVAQGALNITTRKDTNEDGVKESIEITLTPGAKAEQITLRARTNDKKLHGDAVMSVAKPKLVVTSEEEVTEHIESSVAFKIVDPRDESIIFTDQVTLVPSIDVTEFDVEDGDTTIEVVVGTTDEAVLSLAEEYELTVLVKEVDWTTAAKKERTPVINVVVSLASDVTVGSFEVGQASLTADPEKVLIGVPNTITLTYTDANGNPIEGKEVKVDSESLGKTDEAGQVVYTIGHGSNTSVTFEAATDVSGEVVTLKVPATFDMEAPIVEVPAEVDTDTVVLIVKDNSRVARLVINGVEQDIFPVPELKVAVELEEGVNQIHVQAMDNNYNVLDEVVEVTYTPPVQPVSITIGETNEYIDQAPYIVVTEDGAGRAMVPVRFIANVLGAELDWNAETKTATYTLGDIVVEITAGSSTAVVNGENVALDVAAEITGNRMCVPVRFAAEAFGAQVDYEHATKTITITP